MGNSSSCTVAAAVFLVETGAFIGFNGAVRCRLVTKRLSKWEALASVFLLAASLSVLARLLHNTALFGAEDRRLLHGIWISVFAKCEMDFDPVPVGQLLLANWEALRHLRGGHSAALQSLFWFCWHMFQFAVCLIHMQKPWIDLHIG